MLQTPDQSSRASLSREDRHREQESESVASAVSSDNVRSLLLVAIFLFEISLKITRLFPFVAFPLLSKPTATAAGTGTIGCIYRLPVSRAPQSFARNCCHGRLALGGLPELQRQENEFTGQRPRSRNEITTPYDRD